MEEESGTPEHSPAWERSEQLKCWERLELAATRLSPLFRPRFDPGEFDVQNLRLVSDDGMIALCFKEEAIDLEPLVPFEYLKKAVYHGPTVCPDPLAFLPLEAGTHGYFYTDYKQRTRFKRGGNKIVGITGYDVEESDVEVSEPLVDNG